MNASTPTPLTNPAVIPPSTASHALHSLVASVLLEAGFDGADAQVVLELERMTFELITTVHTLSTSYANHSNRLLPTPYDLLEACLDQGIQAEDLYHASQVKLDRTSAQTLEILPPPPPPPAFLPSDDEAENPSPASENGPPTKRKKLLQNHKTALPDYAHATAPPLPPGHSWKNTMKATLPPLPPTPSFAEMDAKLAQTRLVENELGRLIERTQVAVPKQQLLLRSSKPKKDRKGKGKEVLEGGGPVGEGAVGGAATPKVADGAAPASAGGAEPMAIVPSEGDASTSIPTSFVEPLAPPPPPPPAPAPPPMPFFYDEPQLPTGPSGAQLLAQAEAEGLGVVNYRRRGRAG